MQPFWLIGYAGLLWDREKTAFVPMSVIKMKPGVPLDVEVLNRFRFFDETEVDQQIKELRLLGVNGVTKKAYGKGEKQ